jgi:uncharacterized protein YciI
MTIVYYVTHVTDRGRVDASRAEHQVYADALHEHDRLVMGGPLLGDDGRPSGVPLVYEVASKQAYALPRSISRNPTSTTF